MPSRDELRKVVVNRLSILQIRAVKMAGGSMLTQAEEDQIERYADEIMSLIDQQIHEARIAMTKELGEGGYIGQWDCDRIVMKLGTELAQLSTKPLEGEQNDE